MPRLEAARLRTEGDLHLPRCRIERGDPADRRPDRHGPADQPDRRRPRPARPGLRRATGCRSRQDLQAEMIETRGELSLRGAKVGGSLSLRGSRLRATDGRRALNAPQLTRGAHAVHDRGVGEHRHGEPGHHSPVRCRRAATVRRAGRGRRSSSAGAGCGWTTGGSGTRWTCTRPGSCSPTDEELSLRRIVTPELRFNAERPREGRVVLNGAKVVTLIDVSSELAGSRRAGDGRLRVREPRPVRPFPALPAPGVGAGRDPGVRPRAVRAAGARCSAAAGRTRTPARCCWPSSGAGARRCRRREGSGAISRTGRWRTATGRGGPRCGWRCCGRRGRWPSRSTAAADQGRRASAWNPALYALDLLVPVINLGQDGYWRLEGGWQWTAAALVLLGWIWPRRWRRARPGSCGAADRGRRRSGRIPVGAAVERTVEAADGRLRRAYGGIAPLTRASFALS